MQRGLLADRPLPRLAAVRGSDRRQVLHLGPAAALAGRDPVSPFARLPARQRREAAQGPRVLHADCNSAVATVAADTSICSECARRSHTAGPLDHEDGDVMAKRILLPVERTKEMEFALRVTRMIALESGGVVRLLAVMPIPEPVCNRRGYVVLTIDQQIDRLALATLDELRRMAAVDLDGVPVETSVIFGDRAVEIGLEAECFNADLVVMPFVSRGPSPAAVIRQMARRLFAGRSAAEFDVLRVSALRAEPTA